MSKDKKKNQKAKRGIKRAAPVEHTEEDPLVTDSRFTDATWDPRFSRVPKRAKGAIEDERFTTKLKNDTSFREKFTPVDRFGRPKQQPKLDPALRQLAATEDDDEDEDEDEDEDGISKVGARQNVDDDDDMEDEEEDSDDESDFDDFVENAAEELEEIPRGKATKRLAVVGLDWSVTRAVDILASLGSFCPTGKQIKFVEVHPSKFGLERLALEAKLGPQVVAEEDLKVVDQENSKSKKKGLQSNDDLLSDDDSDDDDDDDENDDDDDEGGDLDDMGEGDDDDDDDDDVDNENEKSDKQQAALRRYEEERLKYYYGVVQFEDTKTADAVYEQCDGVEYAQSGRSFDLRFIPEEMVIETTPRDRADSVPDGYTPPNVNLSSLNNSTVKLSWDADPPDRVILKKKAFGKNELNDADLKAYLASSSDEEDEDAKPSKEEIQRKRNLLLGSTADENGDSDGDGGKKDDDMNLEVSFEPGMLEKGEDILRRKMEKDEHKGETEWESRLRRMREHKSEKRKQRREAILAKNRGEDDDDSEDEEDETANGQEVDDENPSFSDPFFTADVDFDEAEEKSKSNAKDKLKNSRGSSKRGKNNANDDDDDDDDTDDEETRKRKQAELELITMDVGRPGAGTGSANKLREALTAADSDDEEERGGKRGKRTRGKRRWQKAAKEQKDVEKSNTAKPSVVDVDDERFQGVFNSHLFAIDPTHPKYRDNETTRRIKEEKGKRAKKRDTSSVVGSNQTSSGVEGDDKKNTSSVSENGAQIELQQLAAKIKARAKNKQSKKKKNKT